MLEVLLLAKILERLCRWISRKSIVSAVLGLGPDSTLGGAPPFEVSRDFNCRTEMILDVVSMNSATCYADRNSLLKKPLLSQQTSHNNNLNATYTTTDRKTPLLCTLLAGIVFGLTNCAGGGGGDSVTLDESLGRTASESVTQATDTGADPALEAEYAAQIQSKINNYRAGVGLSHLKRLREFDSLAAQHNQYMAEQAAASGSSNILISHDNSQSRANAVFAQGFTKFGENVAANRGHTADVLTDNFVLRWIKSTGHRENIEGDFTQTGIDVHVDTRNNTIYATQVFAQ
jgi:uncharacterized protein YkwD